MPSLCWQDAGAGDKGDSERGPAPTATARGPPSLNQALSIASVTHPTKPGSKEREKLFCSWKFSYRGFAVKGLLNTLPFSALPVITVQHALKEGS